MNVEAVEQEPCDQCEKMRGGKCRSCGRRPSLQANASAEVVVECHNSDLMMMHEEVASGSTANDEELRVIRDFAGSTVVQIGSVGDRRQYVFSSKKIVETALAIDEERRSK